MTSPARKAAVTRKTNETDVTLSLNLDGTGANSISTGIGFLDHMLDLFGKHSLIDLNVQAEGDLHIDAHHTAEDVGLVLGQALREALGDKRGISRYGHAYVPMDEALARAVVDFSGRPHLVWDAHFEMPQLGTMETELFREFFQAVTNAAQANVHVHALGRQQPPQGRGLLQGLRARGAHGRERRSPDGGSDPVDQGCTGRLNHENRGCRLWLGEPSLGR